MFSALQYRNYRLFWLGQLVSVTGTFMQGTAQQWLVLTLTSNPLALGIVGALQFGPTLIPFGGAIADRWPRRNVLVATQAASGILAVVLWALTATGVVRIWHVFVLALLLGVVNAVDMPTRQAFISEMVPSKKLLNAVSLNSAQFNASRIVGPGLAGLMIAAFGTPLLFLLNGISYIAVIVSLCMMRSHELMPVPQALAAHGMARLKAMGDGARFVLSTPKVRTTFLMILILGTFGFNFNILLPLQATSMLHGGSAIYGFLSSAMGVGALTGALLLAKRGTAPTNKLLVGMGAAFGLLEASVGLTHSIPLAMVLIALTGFTMSTFSASANTRVQLASPIEMRGRVMAVYGMVFIGTTPIGNLVVSGVASTGSVPLSFFISGLPCLVAAALAGYIWAREGTLFSEPSAAGSAAQTLDEPAPAKVAGNALPLAPDVVPAQTLPSRHRPSQAPLRAPGQPKLPLRAADHE